ncbi:pyridoxamine 5'-phosphate oxidase family protein [Nonomuraea sp. NPDC046570]|uniref:pyridoxamine 5'-phosphate oxidase family protein n=1 Tax=Nonomuraea sp. NPDC046570 TaxID=3155255 RepID=UPI003400FDE4
MFTENEISFLTAHSTGHLATATRDGQPHVVPVLFTLSDDRTSIGIGARNLPDRGQKRRYRRDCEENSQVAFVVDDRPDPSTPRGVLVHGVAKLHSEGGEPLVPSGGPEWVEIIPTMISSWGIDTGPLAPPNRRVISGS